MRDLVQLRYMQKPISIAIVNAKLHQSLRVAQSNSAHLVKVAMLVNSTEDVAGGQSALAINKLMQKVVALSVERFVSAPSCPRTSHAFMLHTHSLMTAAIACAP